MARDTDFVKESMKLTDDSRHLCGEVAGIHGKDGGRETPEVI